MSFNVLSPFGFSSLVDALFLDAGNEMCEVVDTSEFEFLESLGCKVPHIKLVECIWTIKL